MTDLESMSLAELLNRIDDGWDTLQAYISALSESQVDGPTDAVGWTVKDHLTHIAIWENGVTALLNGTSRYEAMGLDRETFINADIDHKNEVIRRHHRDKSVTEVLTMLDEMHQDFRDKLKSMTDADIQRPYQAYAPDSERTEAVIHWIAGNTYEHYEEHLPWMTAIVESAG